MYFKLKIMKKREDKSCEQCNDTIIGSKNTKRRFCNFCLLKHKRENDNFFYQTNKIYYRNYYKKHQKECLASIVKYHNKNKEQWKEYLKKRCLNDPSIRIVGQIRCRTRAAILRNCHTKMFKFQKYIGCSTPELMQHLELNFSAGMDWNNYGKIWHLDHIIPCQMWDFSKKEQQLACFHYTNMMPLFKKANLSKNKSFIDNQKIINQIINSEMSACFLKLFLTTHIST
jgi:hypothetical protein